MLISTVCAFKKRLIDIFEPFIGIVLLPVILKERVFGALFTVGRDLGWNLSLNKLWGVYGIHCFCNCCLHYSA